MKELRGEVGWVKGEVFGGKWEKVGVYDGNMGDVFGEEFWGVGEEGEEKGEEGVEKIEKEWVEEVKGNGEKGKMIEELGVLERDRIEGKGVELCL